MLSSFIEKIILALGLMYGKSFDLNYLTGKIDASANDENTWFLKAECSIDGTKKTCEAKVTGTTSNAEVISFDVY